MQGKIAIEDLAPLNPEIEVTWRHNNAARKRREQEIQGSSQPSPPPSPQSYYQMEEEHTGRVTLEDYFSITTP